MSSWGVWTLQDLNGGCDDVGQALGVEIGLVKDVSNVAIVSLGLH